MSHVSIHLLSIHLLSLLYVYVTCIHSPLVSTICVCHMYPYTSCLYFMCMSHVSIHLLSLLYVYVTCIHSPLVSTLTWSSGAVYRGKYKNENIAVKEFLTQSQAETMYETDDAQAAYDPHDDTITSGEALFLFRDLRQEVTVLAQLSHPNIMSLLGVSLRPMCLVMELAPMGSLFNILDHRLETVKTAHADLPCASLKMPGGVLGHEISFRIAVQVMSCDQYVVSCDQRMVCHVTSMWCVM